MIFFVIRHGRRSGGWAKESRMWSRCRWIEYGDEDEDEDADEDAGKD
jgi:hypothetical protein